MFGNRVLQKISCGRKSLNKYSDFFMSIDKIGYILIKYFEYGILAIIYFSLARIVGPAEYGKGSTGFLIVTYSGFILLGLGPLIVKRFAVLNTLEKQSQKGIFLNAYQLSYGIASGLILILGINLFVGSQYSNSLSLVCCFKVLQDIAVSMHRVRERFLKINFISLTFSVTFLLLFIILPVTIELYFFYWAISLFVSLIYAFWTLRAELSTLVIEWNNYIKWITGNISKIFRETFVFGMMGIITVLLSSIDRAFLVNIAPKEIVGNYQLADNLAMTITLGFGAINYLITFRLLEIMVNGTMSVKSFLKRGYAVAIIVGVVTSIILWPIMTIVLFFFDTYSYLDAILPMVFLSRFLDLVFTIPAIVFMANHREKTYNYLLTSLLVIICLSYSVVSIFYADKGTITIIFPLILVVTKILFLVYLFIYLQRNAINFSVRKKS
jgi:O-antigen/teichoic acid export membrane protein